MRFSKIAFDIPQPYLSPPRGSIHAYLWNAIFNVENIELDIMKCKALWKMGESAKEVIRNLKGSEQIIVLSERK